MWQYGIKLQLNSMLRGCIFFLYLFKKILLQKYRCNHGQFHVWSDVPLVHKLNILQYMCLIINITFDSMLVTVKTVHVSLTDT